MKPSGLIIVTGMHRSGTSMVASLLKELGLSFGDPEGFLEADQWNAKGYYEQKNVMDANSLILTGFRKTVGGLEEKLSKAVYQLTPSRTFLESRWRRTRQNVVGLVESYDGCVLKDPRFCLTLPFWREATTIQKVVVCIRHPEEVVESLKKREGYPRFLGYRFWNYHIRNLLKNVDFSEAIVVNFNELLEGDYARELKQLRSAFALEGTNESLEEAFRKRLDPKLIRCKKTDVSLPVETRKLWTELTSWHKHSLAHYHC